MSVIATLVNGIARRVALKPASTPIDAVGFAVPVQPEPLQTAFATPEINMYEQPSRPLAAAALMPLQFVSSPLPEDRFASREDVAIAFLDRNVQSAAAELSGKIDRLRTLCGYRTCLSAGIRAVLTEQPEDGFISVEAVVHRLRQFSEEIEVQMASARDNIAAHDAAALARKMRHEPLRSACSKLHSTLTMELGRHVDADVSAARAAAIGLPTRYSILRNAGVPEPLIAALEPTAMAPEVLAERRRGRIAEIKAAVSRLEAFQSDPMFNAAPIVGLDPAIDSLIAARDGALPAAVAA